MTAEITRATERRAQAVIYVAPAERRDCCRHCAQAEDGGNRCRKLDAPVEPGGLCAAYRSMVRPSWIPVGMLG